MPTREEQRAAIEAKLNESTDAVYNYMTQCLEGLSSQVTVRQPISLVPLTAFVTFISGTYVTLADHHQRHAQKLSICNVAEDSGMEKWAMDIL